MKKLILILVDIIILCVNIFELVHMGFFRDVHPDVTVGNFSTIAFWISFFVSIILLFAMLCLIIKQNSTEIISTVDKCTIVVILVLICLNIISGVQYYNVVKGYSLSASGEKDYIASEYLRGISLDEFEKSLESEDVTVVYVGRDDCKDCNEFEEKIDKTLEEYHVELQAYYTTEDRDGDRSEEMYDLLDEYGIESVPCMIVTENSSVTKLWTDPINQIDEIEKYL